LGEEMNRNKEESYKLQIYLISHVKTAWRIDEVWRLFFFTARSINNELFDVHVLSSAKMKIKETASQNIFLKFKFCLIV
jgi:hypothetical protein